MFPDIPNTGFFLDIAKYYFGYQKKLFWISGIKYPFSGILDIQNTYF